MPLPSALMQVRMDALGLLCECLRTTEVLTQEELDLIRHFLPHNLNSQPPSVRQQTVSLFKKVRWAAFTTITFAPAFVLHSGLHLK